VFASRVCWRRISDQANGGGDKDLAAHSQSGGQFFGIHASNDGRIMIFAGGIPLKKDGKVVGAIGVSGGSGDQDHAVAEAGAAAGRVCSRFLAAFRPWR